MHHTYPAQILLHTLLTTVLDSQDAIDHISEATIQHDVRCYGILERE